MHIEIAATAVGSHRELGNGGDSHQRTARVPLLIGIGMLGASLGFILYSFARRAEK